MKSEFFKTMAAVCIAAGVKLRQTGILNEDLPLLNANATANQGGQNG